MADIGMLKQVWQWLQIRKNWFFDGTVTVSYAEAKLAHFIGRHWPVIYKWCMKIGRFLFMLLLQWWKNVEGGIRSLFSLGSAALFVILWSYFVTFSSLNSVLCVLVALGAAGAAIGCLGFTPCLFVIGIFGILIMWMYGCFWIVGMLLITGGYVLSLKHARILILLGASSALYFVNTRVGWLGALLSLNLSFISDNILNKFLQVYNISNEGRQFEEQKESMPFTENLFSKPEYSSPTNGDEKTASTSSCKVHAASSLSNVHNAVSHCKAAKSDSTSLDVMRRIMNSSNHYEVLGLLQSKNVDPKLLKKEYHRKVLLVHPDKNMGNSLACESFKKLQCAYEVLSDLSKKADYDAQLEKEEYGNACQRSHRVSQQGGVDHCAQESKRIECTKCRNSHIWICTNRSKARARWCQDCSQYHQAREGDGWIESSPIVTTTRKVEIPRAFVCAENKIFDVSEWAICQEMVCKPNTHGPSFHVNMDGNRQNSPAAQSFHVPVGNVDAEMIGDHEFELWLQQAVASGVFSDTPKRKKSWSPFKILRKV